MQKFLCIPYGISNGVSRIGRKKIYPPLICCCYGLVRGEGRGRVILAELGRPCLVVATNQSWVDFFSADAPFNISLSMCVAFSNKKLPVWNIHQRSPGSSLVFRYFCLSQICLTTEIRRFLFFFLFCIFVYRDVLMSSLGLSCYAEGKKQIVIKCE